MNNQSGVVLLLTMQDYLKCIKFNEKDASSQVTYLVYYVTKVARLREDMTAAVIADRLNGQIYIENKQYGRKILKYTVNHVETILKTSGNFKLSDVGTKDQSQSDRNDNMQEPYILTDAVTKQLDAEFSFDFARLLQNEKKNKLFKCLIIVALIASFFMSIIGLSSNLLNESDPITNFSWKEYKDYAKYAEADNNRKSLLILFYITRLIEYNDSMTPQVLCDRINYLGALKKPQVSEIQQFLSESSLVKQNEDGTFNFTSRGVELLETEINRNYKNRDIISLTWLLSQLSFSSILYMLGGLSSIFFTGLTVGKFIKD